MQLKKDNERLLKVIELRLKEAEFWLAERNDAVERLKALQEAVDDFVGWQGTAKEAEKYHALNAALAASRQTGGE